MALDHWNGSGLSPRAETLLRRLISRSTPALDRDVVMSFSRLALSCARGTSLEWGEGPSTIRRVVQELVEFGAVSIADVQFNPTGLDPSATSTGAAGRRPKVNSYRLRVPEILRKRFEDALEFLEDRRESRRTTAQPKRTSTEKVRAMETTVAAQQAIMARHSDEPVERAKPETVAAAVKAARTRLGRPARAGPPGPGTGD